MKKVVVLYSRYNGEKKEIKRVPFEQIKSIVPEGDDVDQMLIVKHEVDALGYTETYCNLIEVE